MIPDNRHLKDIYAAMPVRSQFDSIECRGERDTRVEATIRQLSARVYFGLCIFWSEPRSVGSEALSMMTMPKPLQMRIKSPLKKATGSGGELQSGELA